MIGLRVGELFNEGFSQPLIISLCVNRLPVKEAAYFKTGCRSELVEFIFVRNVRSHFQMEINILQISLDILAVWHAGVEFANVSGQLVKIF